MPRIARVVHPGLPYHVTHRGNHKARVFLERDDPVTYLRLVRSSARRHRLAVWAYCLMPNHVHLIVVPAAQDSMARTIRRAHGRYALLVHRREGWTGHLWANRHFSSPLDEAHLWAAVRYVETNPVRAGLATRAEEYEWSSARAHTGAIADPILDPARPFPGTIENWGRWLRGDDDADKIEVIRRNTATGRPSGTKEFVRDLETKLGRRLEPRGPGRPRGREEERRPPFIERGTE